jgi:hypothetical protein
MKQTIVGFLTLALLLAPGVLCAVTSEDFEVRTTRNLINLCTVPQSDPLAKEAVHFCHGYLVGAYRYHEAENSGPGATQTICLPTPPPTRNEAIRMFVEWAKANSHYMGENPVETEFRFLTEKWPCKP